MSCWLFGIYTLVGAFTVAALWSLTCNQPKLFSYSCIKRRFHCAR